MRILLVVVLCSCLVLETMGEKAPFKRPRAANAPGNLFVDESCIDCDTCRWMAPSVYTRKGVKAIVHRQPVTDVEKIQALAASIACPVGSIRTYVPEPLVKQALEVFPAEIDPEHIPGVYHLGYHSAVTFGATPYLVKRTQGNIMIDTPRFNTKLARSIEAEGGLRYMVLTHKDNFGDHQKWKDRFPEVQRVLHRADSVASTRGCELLLEGEGTWSPDSDFDILHTPGHTAGSLCVLVRTARDAVMFTGDHLAYSSQKKALDGFKRYNYGSIEAQLMSLRTLAEDEPLFTWILPGHGRMARFSSNEARMQAVAACAEAFEKEDATVGMFGIGYF
jgi:glyoxylase-like metal-dependent hydrolase (beta-lactamase superfamily II)/ferredoxin